MTTDITFGDPEPDFCRTNFGKLQDNTQRYKTIYRQPAPSNHQDIFHHSLMVGR